jgi:hypothetical protein
MARGSSDPLDIERILKQQRKPTKSKARWRIMVASDPSRPVRTFTLPRLLPTLLSLFALSLVAATVILAFGSWKLSGSLGALQHRVRAMVQAADSVALAPAEKTRRRRERRRSAADRGDARRADVRRPVRQVHAGSP